ncbi:MAG TPA: hypothetical protein EYG38_20345, partial [Verrucomicrobia bacterium]|nr:hypothetical protein [Verrucomicrobiota bacterium]
MRHLVHRYVHAPPEDSVKLAVRPMGLALGALAFLGLLRLLAITGIALAILTIAGKVVMICGIVWTAWALTDLISHTFTEH